MQYRDSAIQYDSEHEEFEAALVREPADGKQYRRKRSMRATRRRSSKSAASNPGCGMGARRQKRWTW
jgi:hypothetical protein